MLVDAADYFQALRQAFLKARRQILILGWDIDSRTKLVGPSGHADDGFPEEFGAFLSALANQRPQLTIQLLLWDFSFVYFLEREPLPLVSLQWNTAPGVRLALDGCLPTGAAQHQKIVVVDDRIAFSGGLDITIRRWDTARHDPDNPLRIDPAGVGYRPFHDVQMMVDGAAARALAALAKARWYAATDERLKTCRRTGDAWPASVAPDFRAVDVGIARTQPALGAAPAVREVEKLFIDSIEQAQHTIYIENQFHTASTIAEALAARMRAVPHLELLCVAPREHDSWMAESATRNGRIRFMAHFDDDDLRRRTRFVYPCIASSASTHTMVHSKVMIVDDVFLRVGSANLNRRSMGADTECDLAIEARGDADRRAIARCRNRLLADHCGTSLEDVEAFLAQRPSLIALSRELGARGRSLCDIDDGPLENGNVDVIEEIGDPERPLDPFGLLATISLDRRSPPRLSLILLALAGAAGLALAVLWQVGPLASMLDPERLEALLERSVATPWSVAIVIGAFVAGGLVAFPLNLLIAVTAAAYGSALGFTYAFAGAMASSFVTYAIGALLGRRALANLLGPRLTRIRRKFMTRGILTVAAVRLVPVAPFSLVNLVAGASSIPLMDYAIGTALGLLPGLVLMSALGEQLVEILTRPSLRHIAVLAALVVAWIGLLAVAQALLQRVRKEA